MKRNWTLFFCLAAMTFLVGKAMGQEHTKSEGSSKATPPVGMPLLLGHSSSVKDGASQQGSHAQQAGHATKSEPSERAEGEQRFRENCGRCHQPPHKFPPRIMAAAIRHMRVRAMLTDEDMRLILKYMTE